MNPEKYRLTETEHQAIFERDIKPYLFTKAQSVGDPVAVIFGGQPGAGKSAAVAQAKDELEQRGGVVEIIGDDLRGFHPHNDRLMREDDKTAAFYTDRDTGKWVEKAIEEAKTRRVNVVIEGTMRSGDVVASTTNSLRAVGYEIDVRVLAVNSRFSEQGILQRYEYQKADRGAGRMTTPEAHKAAFDGLPPTLERIEREKLADRVTLYGRGAFELYSNRLRDGQWQHEAKAPEALEFERARPMDLQERRAYAKGFDDLAVMLAAPGRGASSDEIQKNESNRKEARAMVAAEAFRMEPREQATKTYPELSPAYEQLAKIRIKVEKDGLPKEERAIVLARVHENIATQIEKIREPAATPEHKPNPPREPNLER